MFAGFIKLYLIDTCQLRANVSRGMSELNHTERERGWGCGREIFETGESPVGWMRRSEMVSQRVQRGLESKSGNSGAALNKLRELYLDICF